MYISVIFGQTDPVNGRNEAKGMTKSNVPSEIIHLVILLFATAHEANLLSI
ncbi:hypothetical protein L248_1625 [Schleiferilactobacillus shenzhenensis LY-73]|uniref:Uncharacterized protein n=1 Tax=Schleiferilactobacillus shenzhenensis LY-73 TaxID=1231336 RepID=U4TRG2_9LACO|nr:hypothetical protein L248_1625 [Schleiferilactobacillus shenzhenensis LY-73]